MLAVSYEDMKKDPEKVIQDIANFLKVPLTEERKITVAAETTFEAMKLNSSTNYKHWDKYGLRNPSETEFMRKGTYFLVSTLYSEYTIHSCFFEFLSKKYLRQISILGTSE